MTHTADGGEDVYLILQQQVEAYKLRTFMATHTLSISELITRAHK